MNELTGHVVRALPWLLLPLLILLRLRRSRRLDEESADVPPGAPPVSVIVPARNEARNIVSCVRSILATTYPALELIVVDDHSDDGTGELARAAIGADPRGRVVAAPPLPEGWFGKQWACASGAREARGDILLFADADTRHASDLVPRAVNALRAREAALLSVVGRQELGTFWERLIQPQVFGMMASRYGNTEWVMRSPYVWDKIANGQCFLITRAAYEACGGHASVRDNVAEDLRIAQEVFRSGGRVALVLGTQQLTTRMYASLGEIVRGWGKNLYAGGRYAAPAAIGRLLYPVLLVSGPLVLLVPQLQLVLALAGIIDSSRLVDGVVSWAIVAAWGVVVQHAMGGRAWVAPLYPLGSLVLLYICLAALLRGRRVSWKGRRYRSS